MTSDATSCSIAFHWHTTTDEAVKYDGDTTVSLRQVASVIGLAPAARLTEHPPDVDDPEIRLVEPPAKVLGGNQSHVGSVRHRRDRGRDLRAAI